MPLTHTTALDVAQYLIWLGQNERPEEPMYLTQIQLQKILFYAQGWTLIEWDAPLFKERLRVFPHGPAVEEVWNKFRRFGYRPITARQRESSLSASEKDMIRQVWDEYKKYSAWALADLTHIDPAWVQATGGNAPKAPSKKEIPLDALRSSFKAKSEAVETELQANWDHYTRHAEAVTKNLTSSPII